MLGLYMKWPTWKEKKIWRTNTRNKFVLYESHQCFIPYSQRAEHGVCIGRSSGTCNRIYDWDLAKQMGAGYSLAHHSTGTPSLSFSLNYRTKTLASLLYLMSKVWPPELLICFMPRQFCDQAVLFSHIGHYKPLHDELGYRVRTGL